MKKLLTIVVPVVIVLTSCETVKPFQRAYLNDREMQPNQYESLHLDDQVQAYREAASGGGSSKMSGGCGCN